MAGFILSGFLLQPHIAAYRCARERQGSTSASLLICINSSTQLEQLRLLEVAEFSQNPSTHTIAVLSIWSYYRSTEHLELLSQY